MTLYGDHAKERGLMALALNSGNGRKASAELAADETNPLKIPPSTLYRWMDTERERYAELRRETLTEVRGKAAEMHMELMVRNGQVEADALERLLKKLKSGEGDVKDLSAVVQRSAIAGGVHSDKATHFNAQLADEAPPKSADEILRKMQARGMLRGAEPPQLPPPLEEP